MTNNNSGENTINQFSTQELIRMMIEDPSRFPFIIYDLWDNQSFEEIEEITKVLKLEKEDVLFIFATHFYLMRAKDIPEERCVKFLGQVIPIITDNCLELSEDDPWLVDEFAIREIILRGKVIPLIINFERGFQPIEMLAFLQGKNGLRVDYPTIGIAA